MLISSSKLPYFGLSNMPGRNCPGFAKISGNSLSIGFASQFWNSSPFLSFSECFSSSLTSSYAVFSCNN